MKIYTYIFVSSPFKQAGGDVLRKLPLPLRDAFTKQAGTAAENI